MSSSRLSLESVNENSPLVSPSRKTFDDDVGDDAADDTSPLTGELDWEETTTESKSSWYLFLLTLSIGGLQIVWSVELSNGSQQEIGPPRAACCSTEPAACQRGNQCMKM